MPTTTKSHSIVRAVVGLHRLHGALALERFDAGAEQQLDAVVAVQVAVDGADLGAEHALQRHRHRVDHRHVGAALARGGGELGADPAGADHDHPAVGVEALAQGVAVGERAQVVDAVEVGAGDRDPARLGPGRQQQPVVAELARRRRA